MAQSSDKKREYNRTYYALHREEQRARNKTYYANHQEEQKAKARAYYVVHHANHQTEASKAYHHTYYVTHKIEERAKAKVRYAENGETIRARVRAYSKTHRKEQTAQKRIYYKRNPGQNYAHTVRRRAQKRGLISTLTAAQWKAILVAYKHRCAYCGIKSKQLTRDHVIPLFLLGTHTPDNVVPACRSCNSRKGIKTPSQIPPVRLFL